MSKRITSPQNEMLGRKIKECASSTSRSGKVNDRLRRTAKRGERNRLTRDIKTGRYNRLLDAMK